MTLSIIFIETVHYSLIITTNSIYNKWRPMLHYEKQKMLPSKMLDV